MGIRVKNLSEYLLELKVSWTLTAAVNRAVAMVPFPGYIKNIYAKLGTAGTGVTHTNLDINKNGTTIFAATTSQVTLDATTGALTVGTFTTNPPVVAAGDIITVDADAVATNPMNLVVLLKICKIPASGCNAIADQNAA